MPSFTNLSVYSRPHVNVDGRFTKISTLGSVYENIRYIHCKRLHLDAAIV